MNHEYWYLSRAAGFTAYLLLFAAAALGILVSTRLGERVARRNLIFDIHRFTSILALGFSLFHVYILLGDGYFNFNVWQLSLPFISPYRNWQVAAGVFGLYAMAIVVVSFYVRQFVGYRAWRTLHYLTFAMYAAGERPPVLQVTVARGLPARLVIATRRGQSRSLSPRLTCRATTETRRGPISTSPFGSASRLRYQAGCCGAPPFEAMTK